MKKTLTANISGTVFHIEEDAYETLQRYLGSIRAQFSGSEGRNEIMADIEARIAELFSERLDGRRQVVSIADVEHVMAVMGQPEDFADGESADTTTGAQETSAGREGGTRKRFFRDDEDKWIGGVLGGLGAYIGVDPLWLRIAMIALVMASVGSLIPIYILLWILVPKAVSAADRLQMQGEAVTVENIKRTVEEAGVRMKQGGERFASEAGGIGQHWRQEAAQRKSGVLNVITKLIGIAFIIFAFSLLLSLVTGMIGGTVSLWHSTWTSADTGILDLGELFFASRDQAMWFGIGLFTLLVVPVIGLFLAGFRLLLDTRTPKWLGWTLTAAWILAWVPTLIVIADLANEFKRENSVLTEIELVQPPQGLLYLDALAPADSTGDWSVSFYDADLSVDLEGLHLENGVIFGAWGTLDVERSADTLFHLKVTREAHGITPKIARGRAEHIQYNYRQEGDVLLVSPVIRYDASDKLRGQDAHFTLEIPVGKSVFLRPGSRDVIYDVDNLTNTHDDDMLGRTWTMTARGLQDLDAPGTPDAEQVVPTDTVKASTVAAIVYRGPVKRKAPASVRPTFTETPVAEASMMPSTGRSLVPNLLGLLIEHL